MQELLDQSMFGNTALGYLTALGIFLGGMIAIHVFRKFVLSRMRKWAEATRTSIDDLVVAAIEKSLIPALYLGVLFVALHSLNLAPEVAQGLRVGAIVLITILIGRSAVSAANFGLQSYVKNSSGSANTETQIRGIRGLVNVAIWALVLVFMLDNLGIKVSAVVAGLGIGGIAVALAAQTVLGDLFSYFVIFFDKPFEIGDFIIIGDKMGVVEYTGIKTTRIRALGGEQIVFSNTDLTNSRIHNYKKMERRRVVFKLGVIYQTTAAQLKTIPQIVRNIVETQPDTAYDRGHFSSFGDFSLDFEFVYYVNSADYAKYMDTQQAINLAIFEAFEREKIEFAYPSQTLFVNKAA